jgi:hypothetical protein
MKRILLTAVTSSLLGLAIPGVASASHGKRHHHASSHKRHASRARIVRFGSLSLPAASGPTQATPTTPTAEPAGKVVSFENGVLTIMLADQSTVSGKVTEATELQCRSASAATTTGGDDQGGGDDAAGDQSGEHSGASTQAHASDLQDSQDQQGDDDANEDSGQQSCTTAALVKGAVVGEAELKLSSAGAVWEKVELLQ